VRPFASLRTNFLDIKNKENLVTRGPGLLLVVMNRGVPVLLRMPLLIFMTYVKIDKLFHLINMQGRKQ